MNDEWTIPHLARAPDEYDPVYFENWFLQLTRTLEDLKVEGNLRVGTINISSLPTSAAGLRTGDLWNDAGTVKVA